MSPITVAPGRDRWVRLLLPVGFAVLAVGVVAAAVVTHSSKGIEQVTLPASTAIVASLEHSVTTEGADVGDRVTLQTVDSVVVDGQTVLPPGSVIRGEVTHVRDGGRIAGAPELTLRFTELESGAGAAPITARPLRLRGTSDAAESAAEIGGGAVAGGILGGVLGGGKAAVAGAVLGAAAGTAVAVATKGGHIVLPAGQRLTVRLTEPVTIAYRAGSPG